MKLVSTSDLRWVKQRLMPRFNLTRLSITEDLAHTASYPDIWVSLATSTITVTRAWARQGVHERRSRLVHECLHIAGMPHNARSRRLGYFSVPAKDTYSRQVYESLR